jgi:hypothetical protein
MHAKTVIFFLSLFAWLAGCSEGAEYVLIEPEGANSMAHRRRLIDDFEHEKMRMRPNKKIPKVLAIEPTRGSWSNNPALGQSVEWNPDTTNFIRDLIKAELGPPEVRTVTLAIEQLEDQTGSAVWAIKAKVIVGCGSSAFEFYVDWRNGTTFSLPMSALEVAAMWNTEFSPVNPPNLLIGAWVGKGGKYTRRPTYSVSSSAEPGSFSDVVQIPKFASKVRFIATSGNDEMYLPGASFGYFVISYPSGARTTKFPILTAGDFSTMYKLLAIDGIPIPEGARAVQFFNSDGAATIYFIVEFELDL